MADETINTETAKDVTPSKSAKTGDLAKPRKAAKKAAPAKKAASGKAPARQRAIRAGGWELRHGRWTLPKGKS